MKEFLILKHMKEACRKWTVGQITEGEYKPVALLVLIKLER